MRTRVRTCCVGRDHSPTVARAVSGGNSPAWSSCRLAASHLQGPERTVAQLDHLLSLVPLMKPHPWALSRTGFAWLRRSPQGQVRRGSGPGARRRARWRRSPRDRSSARRGPRAPAPACDAEPAASARVSTKSTVSAPPTTTGPSACALSPLVESPFKPEVLEVPVEDLTNVVGGQDGRHVVAHVAAHPCHGLVEVEHRPRRHRSEPPRLVPRRRPRRWRRRPRRRGW